jgi:hypothetical protein
MHRRRREGEEGFGSLEATGFEPVESGPLSNSGYLEHVGEMNINFGFSWAGAPRPPRPRSRTDWPPSDRSHLGRQSKLRVGHSDINARHSDVGQSP